MTEAIASFDRAAGSYETHAAPQAALATDLASWLLPHERTGNAIEFGAGTGLLTRQLLPWKGRYIATDAAPRMVSQGRAQCPSVSWKVADARTPEHPTAVDWIFACGILQWMHAPENVLRTWRDLLASSGNLIAAVWLKGTLGELHSLIPDAEPVRLRGENEWRTIFKDAGFEILRAETRRYTSTNPSARALLRSIHKMGLAPKRAVGPGKLRSVLRTYDSLHATPGGVFATWNALLIRAKPV